ncbi:CheR-type MCP methyltransferase [Keratinibaculum paraultunense]|uniref:protein-glutamate O-methyltransferase n=1 Tax=Keratinibaculum paraultunense TaxID=1278232 RepID=A0A4R3L0A1_9FIRM|nr:protein-glutamate O-methyltransferase CheR [Keratinibaculum paraultunense]QQY80657.1 protein-glutamate O-methyltransferase CheR [Keratinibaculum paraultunense]TCS91392.1 CheR-type MCP methyltransferase [Keratinibaculum paraultunense]
MDKYEIFKKNINNLIGINLDYYKEKQMKRRITSLMNRNGFEDFDEYFMALKSNKDMLEQFINHLTINVSEFYRNPAQWSILEKEILPELIRKNDNKPLKVWSAACSTGEEPYSLVMLLSKFYDLKDIKVLASDIDEEAIEKAKLGIYSEKALVNLPKEFKIKYFDKVGNSFKIKDIIKNQVIFDRIDLLKDPFPINIDLITCRNVMIYFTDEAKELLYDKLYRSLSKNGVLFVGSTEQIILPERYNFKTIKTFFYTKIN